jgi:hypothetical protein
MFSVHPHLLYDLAMERQRELLAEAERNALAKQARSGSKKASSPRSFRPHLVLVGAAKSALAFLL